MTGECAKTIIKNNSFEVDPSGICLYNETVKLLLRKGKVRKRVGMLKRLCKWFAVAVATLGIVATVSVIPGTGIKAEAAGAVAQGIDVSSYQGVINWQAVKNSGVTFAFVRVGTSKTIDTQYINNLQGAAAAGIRTGVYFYTYATTPEQAANEAALVLQLIAPYQVSFPVAIDIEAEVQKSLTPDQLQAIANSFCTTIGSQGYYPMVYASRNWFVQRIGNVAWDKWVAQYNSVNSYPGAYGVWQYTSSGAVNGINGRVDMDYLFTNYSSIIIPQGFSTRNGITYYYSNYRWQKGWVTDNGGLYYCGLDGAVQTGWFTDGAFNYYLDPAQNGKAAVGYTAIAGKQYDFNEAGAMLTGLLPIGDKVMYFGADGAAVKGFATLPDGIRYFGDDYAMLTGMQTINKNLYSFDANGIMQVGMQTVNNALYMFGADGAAVKGFFTNTDGKIYYFGDNYAAVTGAQTINKAQYMFNPDGSMFVGWYGTLPTRSYYKADGTMATGWNAIDGLSYYFDANGMMQTGLLTIKKDGTYYLDVDGHQVTGFVQIGAGYYYFDPATGKMVKKKTINIAGLDCTFDKTGLLVAPAGLVPPVVSAVAPQ